MRITYIGDNPDGTLVCPHTGFSYEFKKGVPIEVAEITGISATKGPLWRVVEAEPNTSGNQKKGKE